MGTLLVTLEGSWRWWSMGGGGPVAFVTEVDGERGGQGGDAAAERYEHLHSWHAPAGRMPARCCASVAGVRVLTSEAHLLLRRVPPAAVRVLEMGSTAPGALLYDARRLFDAQDARATGGWVPGLPADVAAGGRVGNFWGAAVKCARAVVFSCFTVQYLFHCAMADN